MREQLNALTAFLDVGQVYGADEGLARDLRDLTTDSGLLRVNDRFSDNGRELLPFSRMKELCASRGRITNDANAEEVPCFIAGKYAHVCVCLLTDLFLAAKSVQKLIHVRICLSALVQGMYVWMRTLGCPPCTL